MNRRKGFTIVELLVVIGILVVLIGLLMPALAGAQTKARKTREVSRLRQVGIAWSLYATNNGEAAIPGYLSKAVQSKWRAVYRYPNKTEVPPALAANWPWRLAPYLGYSHDVLLGYRDLAEPSELGLGEATLHDPAPVPGGCLYSSTSSRPQTYAEQPAFGYNGFYIGGWWDLVAVQDGTSHTLIPRPRFASTRSLEGRRANVVAASPSTISRSSDFVVFCSTGGLLPTSGSADCPEKKLYKTEIDDLWPGSPFAVPSKLATTEIWRQRVLENHEMQSLVGVLEVVGTVSGLEIGENSYAPVPIGRYNQQAAVLHADGHASVTAPGSLQDQRLWINAADGRDWTHEP